MKSFFTFFALLCFLNFGQSQSKYYESNSCNNVIPYWFTNLNEQILLDTTMVISNDSICVDVHCDSRCCDYFLTSPDVKAYKQNCGSRYFRKVKIKNVLTTSVVNSDGFLEWEAYFDTDNCHYFEIKYPVDSTDYLQIFNCYYNDSGLCYKEMYRNNHELCGKTFYRPIEKANEKEIRLLRNDYWRLMVIPIKDITYSEGQVLIVRYYMPENYLNKEGENY